MPQYFFDVRSTDWDYTDPDGIALPDDEAAIIYAERMIGELKEDGGYDAPDLQMLARKRCRADNFFDTVQFQKRLRLAKGRCPFGHEFGFA